MRTRFFGAVLAASWLVSFHGVAWAQHRGHTTIGAGRSHGSTRVVIAPQIVTAAPFRPVFAQPYYAFRPRTHLGFGFYLGYPVAYPARYFYPNALLYSSLTPTYPYATPIPTYPYMSSVPMYPTASAPYGTVIPNANAMVAPGAVSTPPAGVTGGVSFQITPGGAAVFVDGVYVGTASNFSPMTPPLLMAAGRHHFELRAQGYGIMAFDVDVVPGQVVPYEGTLPTAQP